MPFGPTAASWLNHPLSTSPNLLGLIDLMSADPLARLNPMPPGQHLQFSVASPEPLVPSSPPSRRGLDMHTLLQPKDQGRPHKRRQHPAAPFIQCAVPHPDDVICCLRWPWH